MDDKLAKKRLSLQRIINKMHAEEVFVIKPCNFFKDQNGTIVKVQKYDKQTGEILTTEGRRIFAIDLMQIQLTDVFFERHGLVHGYLTTSVGCPPDAGYRHVYLSVHKKDDVFYNVYCDLFTINIRCVHEFQNLMALYNINLSINPYNAI